MAPTPRVAARLYETSQPDKLHHASGVTLMSLTAVLARPDYFWPCVLFATGVDVTCPLWLLASTRHQRIIIGLLSGIGPARRDGRWRARRRQRGRYRAGCATCITLPACAHRRLATLLADSRPARVLWWWHESRS